MTLNFKVIAISCLFTLSKVVMLHAHCKCVLASHDVGSKKYCIHGHIMSMSLHTKSL